MSLLVFNTLTGKKEEFVPAEPPKVGMYICGPTVYNFIHVGNARTYVSFDIILRYLRYRGYEVTYVRNITDVDDKIINKARDEERSPETLAQHYAEEFHKDADSLGLLRPNGEPRATEHIAEMLNMVEALVEKGNAYEVDGDVYFSVKSFPDYGKLSHRELEEMRAGERVEVDPRKRHPMDFALWKRAGDDEPGWASPWGRGRPGWHIECSAMSEKYLGMGFDIHGGGQDLIFPHHENEIAQAEASRGAPAFVRYWLHGGLLNINDEKMAKSVGNILLVRELFEERRPEIFRLLCLGTHYRSPIGFSGERMEEAASALRRMENALSNVDYAMDKAPVVEGDITDAEKGLAQAVVGSRKRFVQAMDDDFNTPLALGVVFELIRAINQSLEEAAQGLTEQGREIVGEARETLLELPAVVGLDLDAMNLSEFLSEDLLSVAQDILVGEDHREKASALEALMRRREDARKGKDWKTADSIRTRLEDVGVEIEDTPQGPRWKLKV